MKLLISVVTCLTCIALQAELFFTPVFGESIYMEQKPTTPLAIVQLGDPVLRQEARRLTEAEILSEEIQSLITRMIVTMRQAPGVGLAAPQVGYPLQIIVIEDRVEYHGRWNQEQLEERGRVPTPLQVIINPELHMEPGEAKDFFEGCLSVPELIGIVSRAYAVTVEGVNERAEPVKIHATGWLARILQHEIDHLKGVIYLDRVQSRSLTTADNYEQLWRCRPVQQVQEILRAR